MRQSGGHMRHSQVQLATVRQVHFGLMSQQEIQRYTIDEINTSRIYEQGVPIQKGLNDMRLGITNNSSKCLTCKQSRQCPGHFARIKLQQPVFHYWFMGTVVKILNCICLNCSMLRHPTPADVQRVNHLSNSSNSRRKLNEISKLLSKVKICAHPDPDDPEKKLKYCGRKTPKKIYINKQFKIQIIQQLQQKKRSVTTMNAAKILHILQRISEQACMNLGFKQNKPKNLIIRTLLVCPPQVRPSIQMNPVRNCQDDLTVVYTKIIEINNKIKNQTDMSQIIRQKYVQAMQRLIASIMDKKVASKAQDKAEGIVVKVKQGGKVIKSITQRLKGKQGRFRQHLMGKRVDFSARSVISPDSSLALDELGVPQKVAAMLTFPQQITALNFDRIVQLCLQKKVLYLLKPTQDKKRYQPFNVGKFQDRRSVEAQLNYGMIAQRTLQDGDWVLFNRQPTLHRMSMMCHRVKILPHSTFRLNLSVCTPYNADFDGDQMNMHVPQNYQTVAQLKHIAHVPNQIVTPKHNAPVMGIVQDSLLGIYLFTLRSTFLTRQQVMNLVVWIQDFEGNLPLPAIIKPQPLWSGKQVISLLINNRITMSNMKGDVKDLNPKDNSIILHRGQLLTGALTKQIVGSGAGGLVHIMWLDISSQDTCDFMTMAQRIVNSWLVDYGFTCGASDVVPPVECKRKIQLQRKKVGQIFDQTYNMFFDQKKLQQNNLMNRTKRVIDSLQIIVNQKLNKQLRDARNIIQETVSTFSNNLFKMISAKSKGSQTNLTQILGILGNQNVDGQRLPQGFYKRALCHFHKDDYSPQARGFIFSSFYQGLKAHQFFFHSPDAAVKTSRTGYIQRKLIKALQDVITKYDSTVRDSQNGIIQRLYGEDGMSAELIQLQKIPALQYDNRVFQEAYKWSQSSLKQWYDKKGQLPHSDMYTAKGITDILNRQYNNLLKGRQKLRNLFIKGGEINNIYAPVKLERILTHARNKAMRSDSKQSRLHPVDVVMGVQAALQEMAPTKYVKQFLALRDQKVKHHLLQIKQKKQFDQRLHKLECQCGVQLIRILIRIQLSSKVICGLGLNSENFKQVLQQVKIRYKQALVKSGQPIGAIAAQSVGQPTTQMTLNTFHLAGVSENNVTLGVPRIQQLFDASKKMKTPSLKIHMAKQLDQRTLLDFITNKLPQHEMAQYIISSKIYFDWNPSDSQVKQIIMDDVKDYKGLTPWVLVITFDKTRKILYDLWLQITQTIINQFNKFCEINPAIFSQQKLAILLRCKTNALDDLDNKNFKTFYQLLIHFNDTIATMRLGNGIKGIKKVFKREQNFLVQQSSGQLKKVPKLLLQTKGSNLREVLGLQFVDPNKTLSNDIMQTSQVLGIQAARMVFIKEFQMVLGCYNIYINFRHTNTLADWMTKRGKMTPINRNGINRISEISVLRKASFEETVKMMYEAAIHGQVDPLKGISEKIILGQSCEIGTNTFDIIIDRKKTGDFFKINKKDKFQLDDLDMLPKDRVQPVAATPFLKGTPNPYMHTPNREMFSPGPSSTSAAFSPFTSMTPKPHTSPYHSPYIQANIPSTSPYMNSPASFSRNIYSSPYYSSSPLSVSSRSNDQGSRIWTNSPNYESHLSGHYDSTPHHSLGESPSYSSRQETPYSTRRRDDDFIRDDQQ